MQDEEAPAKRESTFPLFSRFFPTHPQDVVDHMGFMRKQMEDFIEAFKKRIQVEVNYSKSLTQVSKSLDKYIKPGTELASSFISSAFKVEHEQRSRQAMQLAESLKTQVESMCGQFLKKETAFVKKLQKDVKKYYKEAGSVEENHQEALSRFESISREMEEMIITKNIMKYTTGIPQQKKVKLISKTMDSIRQNKEYEKLYLQSVKSFNSFANAYNQEIKEQLDTAEIHVRDQVTMQCDSLRKLIVAEVSMFKNIEYDLLNISKQMEHLDTQKEVEVFVEENKNSSNNRIVNEQKTEQQQKRNSVSSESGDNTVQLKKVLGKSMLSNSLLHVDEEYFSWMLFNKKNKKIRDIISGIWKQLKEKRDPKQKEEKTIELTQGDKIQSSDKMSSIQEPKDKEEPKEKEEGPKDKEEEPKEEKLLEKEGIQQNEEPIEDNRAEVQQKQGEDKVQSSGKQEQNQKEKQETNTDWNKELKQFLSSFKIQHPPNLLASTEKGNPSLIKIDFEAFVDIMSTISLLWNNEHISPEQTRQHLDSLEKHMKQHHLYRLIALIFLEQYRIQLEVMIKSPECAKVCGKVLKVIIRESQRQNDTFIIRGILGLVFTYYWIDDKFKKLMHLNPEVYQCDIWKKLDFWEAAIFETTYEEMSMFSKQKGETPAETILREKNIIFSQLASFCHYMVMSGITSKNVRLIVGRYCRLYQMTDQQNKDLSKMITNTAKQFKEISFQFSLKDKSPQE